MQRTKTHNPPTAILTSDWHLREDTPICRTDDYWSAQWKKVDFISDLQEEHNCVVLHAGDLFDHWKPSPNLLRETILRLPNHFLSIYGQHDLPQHNLDLVNKCGLNVLEAAGKLKILHGTHYGQIPTEESAFLEKLKVLVWHHMTYIRPPYPGATEGQADGIVRKYPQYDLILTGDNHQGFTTTYEGRQLVNPGSLMRMDANQIDFKPHVYLWYADDNSIEAVYLPIEEGVITREHIEKQEERDNRIDAFISSLDGEWETKLKFEENLEQFKQVNKVRESVMEIVYKAID